VRTAGLEPALS